MSRLVGPQWKKLRWEILARDQFICSYCVDSDVPLTVDHIFPVVLGGSNDPSNLTAACVRCNCSKGKLTLSQWMARDGFTLPPWCQGWLQ